MLLVLLDHRIFLYQSKKFFFGHECIDLLTTIPKAAANKIRMDCLQFYIISLEEIQRRLPLGTGIFKEMEFLSPEIAMGVKGNKNDFTFKNICSRFNVDAYALLPEWRTFEFNFKSDEKDNLLKMGTEEFWITKMKNLNDNFLFPTISKLAKFVLTLPHANADSERIFSIVTDVRTKKRNKLSHANLTSICIIRSFLQDENLNCCIFQCKESHLKKLQRLNSTTIINIFFALWLHHA
uniref:HAT C-terminal dimerisation domain-containing protein n=1 Tax=Bactrocera latifrons TaxID=174628 RepID=A0A0K8TX93_BACLA